jgi:hypothetical protein
MIHAITRNPRIGRCSAEEALKATGGKLHPAVTDLMASNVAKYLQQVHDEARSEVSTIGRSIQIKGALSGRDGQIDRLTARKAKYEKMQARADELLGKGLGDILALLKGKPVTHTAIRALCEGGGA